MAIKRDLEQIAGREPSLEQRISLKKQIDSEVRDLIQSGQGSRKTLTIKLNTGLRSHPLVQLHRRLVYSLELSDPDNKPADHQNSETV